MLYFIVYLFDVYGPILKTVLGFAIFMFVGVIALLMQTKEAGEDATPETIKEVEDENQKITEKAGKALSKGLFALILYILLPSKQGLAMLGGVYVGTEIYEGLNKSTLVEKSVKILNKELDNYLDQYLVEPVNSAKAATSETTK
nr:MAG TPA: hypothetical protein [Caudoviricetes sp.]